MGERAGTQGNKTIEGPGWLSGRSISAIIVIACLPFLLVEIPPLIDVPGHIQAAAIEQAATDSPLARHYSFDWHLTLNMGGELLMKVLGFFLSPLASGWWASVIATASFIGGALALARVLNRAGSYAMGWALMFAFGFPWIWGFLNFILAAGLSLLLSTGIIRLEHRPKYRTLLLLVAQPVVLVCHAIGGLLLPIIVASYVIGHELDARLVRGTSDARSAKEISIAFFRKCWPLITTLITVLIWSSNSTSAGIQELDWHWPSKEWSMKAPLRDQFAAFDTASALAAYLVLLGGALIGARWSWRQGLPALFVALFFFAMPARINGTEAVDARIFPVAIMLALILQDWRHVDRELKKLIAFIGFVFLAARLTVTSYAFAQYDDDYRRELQAVNRITIGSMVHRVHEISCDSQPWRQPRLDTLATLASVYRSAWVNDAWAIPGVHLLRSKHTLPSKIDGIRMSVSLDRDCRRPGQLSDVMSRLPVESVDYVWLVGTGIPRQWDSRLFPVWQEGRSILFEVRKLPGQTRGN